MANVLLLTPPVSKSEMFARGSESTASLLPPLGIASIAGYIRRHGHAVSLIDGCVEPLSVTDIVGKAADCTVVGISVGTSYYLRAWEVVTALRSAYPDKPILVGGPHVSVMPGELLKAGASLAVIGEGEETTREVLDHFDRQAERDLSAIPGIAYLNSAGELGRTSPRPPIRDLDSIPMPALELLPMHRYGISAARSSHSPSLPLMATRGCNGTCTFCCHQMFGHAIRRFSPGRVIAEILRLRDSFGAKSIAMMDDNFISDPAYLEEICSGLIQADLGIPFSVQARVDAIDEPKLAMLKRAGCDYIAYGFESGSQRVLDSVQKRETLAQMEEAVRITKKSGIPIRGYFILGFPGETMAEMDATVAFAKKLDLDVASFSLLIPFPGTVEYQRAQKSGEFDPLYFARQILPEFHFPETPVYVPAGITRSELLQRHRTAYNEYYFRVKPILRKIAGIRTLGDLVNLYKAGNTLIKNFFFTS